MCEKIKILAKLKGGIKNFKKIWGKCDIYVDFDVTKKKVHFRWWFVFKTDGAMSLPSLKHLKTFEN